MVYTEIKIRNGKKYYYRVLSVRQGNRVKKKREYLGANLDKQTLKDKEREVDRLFLNEKIRRNIEKIKLITIAILKKYKVKKASLFGSYARGEQNKNSDIDILIEPPSRMGLEFVGMALNLEKALKRKVDLVTYKGINPHLKKYILEDEIRII